MGPQRVLVTGCSSGIGLALAVRLAKDELGRFEVVATMRDMKKSEALEKAAGEALGTTLEIRQLDVCSEESIRECINSLSNRRVDILVSNAGVGMIGPMECQTMKEMEDVFNTNFFGLVRLVKEVLPDMKKRQSGHIVVMSSIMGLQGVVFNDIYAASKFAVEGFCESLGVQAMKFNIKITLMEPGPVLTEFEKKLYEEAYNMDLSGTDEETARAFRDMYLCYSRGIFTTMSQTPDQVAEQTHQMIVKKNPPFRHQTNRLYMPMVAMKFADPSGRLPINVVYKTCFEYFRLVSTTFSIMSMMKRHGKFKM